MRISSATSRVPLVRRRGRLCRDPCSGGSEGHSFPGGDRQNTHGESRTHGRRIRRVIDNAHSGFYLLLRLQLITLELLPLPPVRVTTRVS